MALDIVDGFSHYTALADKGWTVSQSGGSAPSAGSGAGRFSGSRWNNGNDYRNGSFKSMSGNYATVWAVAGFQYNTTSNGTDIILMAFRDSGTNQVELRMTSTNLLRVTRNGTTLATGTTAMSTNTWLHLEFSATIHPSAGVVTVKLNGTTEISLTSQNTRASANSYANQFMLGLGGPALSGSMYFCDLACGNDQGNAPTSSPGDIRVFTSYPTGVGTTTQLTPSAGSNYQTVDETTGNGDTDYVSSATAGNLDTYAITDLPATASTVLGLQHNLYARKDDAGTREIIGAIRTASTNYEIGTQRPVTASYRIYTFLSDTNPNTSVAYTVSDINGLEAGPKIKV